LGLNKGFAFRQRVDYCSLHSEVARLSYFEINYWTLSTGTKITDCPIKIFPNTKTNDTVLQIVSLHNFKAMFCIAAPDLNHSSATRPTVLEFQRRSNLIPRKTIPLTSFSPTSNLTQLLSLCSQNKMWKWMLDLLWIYFIRFWRNRKN
jgi:hypothetical protein